MDLMIANGVCCFYCDPNTKNTHARLSLRRFPLRRNVTGFTYSPVDNTHTRLSLSRLLEETSHASFYILQKGGFGDAFIQSDLLINYYY